MELNREQAYRLLLSAGLLHIKWDLACLYQGFSWRPRLFLSQARKARRAAFRAAAFHNLAIFATCEFEGFSEERFWNEIESFLRNFPERDWSNYREMFEASLRGEQVNIIAPREIAPFGAE